MTVNECFATKDVVIIHYVWWAMQRQDRKWWCAILNENVVDYHTKNELIKMAEAKGQAWAVVRFHKKKKGVTVIKTSQTITDKTE